MRTDRRRVLKSGGLALVGAGVWNGVDLLEQVRPPASRPAPPHASGTCACTTAADGTRLDTGTSEMRPVIARYQVELQEVGRRFIAGSALHRSKSEQFYAGQLHLLETVSFDALSQPGRVDYLLLRSRLLHDQKQLALAAKTDAEIEAILPLTRDYKTSWKFYANLA